jgi:hypothetical protein
LSGLAARLFRYSDCIILIHHQEQAVCCACQCADSVTSLALFANFHKAQVAD